MTKYFNYYGAQTDTSEYHVVESGCVKTYERKFLSASVKETMPLNRGTQISNIFSHGTGQRGYCDITTDGRKQTYYVANDVNDFINEVRQQIR